MSQWSPLLYGRTYEVDFRMLAMPDYLTDSDKQWALKHILATTHCPERLFNNPRWSLFSNGKYCAIGVACSVAYLAANSSYRQDVRDRPLYIFIGYVARMDWSGKFPPLPWYEDLNADKFTATYQQYISQCWAVKNYEPASKQPILTQASETEFCSVSIPTRATQFTTNLDPNYLGLYPEADRSQVWNNAVLAIANYPDRGNAIALGLSPGKELNNSPFLNLTLPDVDAAKTIAKIRQSNLSTVRSQELVVWELDRDLPDPQPSVDLHAIGECVGIIAVGILVGVFCPPLPLVTIAPLWRVMPLLLLGSGLGSLTIGCLTNRGVGGMLRRKTGELLMPHRATDRPSPDRQRNNNLGFKELDRQNNDADRQDWY